MYSVTKATGVFKGSREHHSRSRTTRQYNIKNGFPIRRGAVNAKWLNSEDMETAIFVFLPIRKTLEHKRSSNTFYIEYICLFGEV